MSNTYDLENFSYVLNGPLTCLVAILGVFFNIFTIFVIRKRDSKRVRKETRSDSTRINHALLVVDKDLFGTSENRSHISATTEDTELLPMRPFLLVPEKKIQKRRKPRICLYFSWLIGCDTALLIGSLLNYAIPTTMSWYTTVYATMVPFWYVLCNATLTCNVWIIFLLVGERYRVLCHGFVSSVLAHTQNSQKIHKIGFFVIVISFLYNFPRYFELNVTYVPSDDYYSISSSYLTQNYMYMIGYRIVGSLVFYSAMPYIVIFFMSYKVLNVIRTVGHVGYREKGAHGCANPNPPSYAPFDSDKVLMALAIRFLVSRLLTTLLDVAESAVGFNVFFDSPYTLICSYLSNFLVVFSSASSFLMFFMFSKKFRAALICSKGNCLVVK